MFDQKVTEIMFEKTLIDIVKGIRASKRDTGLYISKCISEIKKELNSTDLYVKSNALNKLTFLQMMGYGMSYASFPTIEVMSSPRFAHKRIGYLAACQGFNQNTEVILLTTNLLQKELRRAEGGMGMYETGLAINCISNIVTEELARDVLPELTNLTNHQQPYLRKKAVLCLFKLFMKYPQALRMTFDKIQKSLEDPNPSVVSCAVNVITELSDKNAKNYLHLAPAFFQLLTQSQNNWMLIKVVKLLGSLVPEEPRLARKLLEPLANMTQTTQAKSLLYEAVYTITLCLPYCVKADGSMPASVPAIVQHCGKILKEFCADKDQNLKYLGLVGFSSLRVSHPKCLMESDARPLILGCLSDDDITIRKRALDLLPGMTSRKNLQELVAQLISHVQAASGDYRKDLVLKIIELCSSEKYALLQDFSWYLDILFKLAYVNLTDDVGEILGKQITDVALRVLPIRPYAVKKCSEVLVSSEWEKLMPQVLPAAAWIVGEYANLLEGNFQSLVFSLTLPSNIEKLATSTQSVYLQTSLKVFAAATNDEQKSESEQCVKILVNSLPLYMQSLDVEVQERAFTGLELLRSLNLMSGLPELTAADEIDSDDGEDNLLGMVGGQEPVKLEKKNKKCNLSSRFRETAATLNFLFKPDPMKPVSTKAQRKKFQAPLGGIDFDWLTAPLDKTAFSFSNDAHNISKPSMEQVSFTQQRPYKAQSQSNPTLPISQLPAFGINSGSLPLNNTGGDNSALNQNRPQDPFYLDSGKASTADSTDGGKFGTIQLLGDDDKEDDDSTKKKRKKKEKKRKKQEPLPAFNETNLSPLEVYDSGDDDDDDDDDYLLSMNKPTKSGVSKDFVGLASVDLTAPIRENEFSMPNREHRQVPDRANMEDKKASKKKKKKKEKESKRKEKVSADAPAMNGIGDLLDLGGFSSVADVSNPTILPTGSQGEVSSNVKSETMAPASSTLNDLLGLDAPSPSTPSIPMTADPLASMNPTIIQSSSQKKSGKKTWMKATIKSANGSGSSVNWNEISMLYKVSMKDSGDATMTIRVQNKMPTTALNNLVLNMKNGGTFSIGTVEAQDSNEMKKVGPFKLENSNSSTELKGTLSTSDNCTVPVKITLSASFQCSPTHGLTLDGVMQELSNGQFTAVNSKVEIKNTMDSDKVKTLVASFFNAALVENSWMLAAQSQNGAKIRILLKMKGNSLVKVDIKCTDATLCKALGSDVKKLFL